MSDRLHAIVRKSEAYAFCAKCQKSVVGDSIVWRGNTPYCADHAPEDKP